MSGNRDRCTAIVLAAGRGSRMHTAVPKQYMELGGLPLFAHAALAFDRSSVITDIVVAGPPGDLDRIRQDLAACGADSRIRAVVPGGAERCDSVMAALEAVTWECRYVFIHDGARPFIDDASIRRLYEGVRECGACVAAMPSKDTVKIADDCGFVTSTPDRAHVWIIQTPQVFELELIRDAYRSVLPRRAELAAQDPPVRLTDDAMMLELAGGHPVRLIEASYDNIKITTPEDLAVAEAILARRARL